MSFAPENIHIDTWPAVFEVLRPGLAEADYTVPALIDDLLAGRAQLWVLREWGKPVAVAVSELVPMREGLVVHGRLLAGKGMRVWLDDALDCVRRHARNVGAVGIDISGRKGWERVLAAKGWRRRAVVMRLMFEPEGVN